MTELFNIYQDNIKIAFSKITKILDNTTSKNSGEKSENSLNDAENHLKEAERLVC
jgi:hypothetical protein